MLDLIPPCLERPLSRLCAPVSRLLCWAIYGERRTLCARAYARGDWRFMARVGRGHCERAWVDHV